MKDSQSLNKKKKFIKKINKPDPLPTKQISKPQTVLSLRSTIKKFRFRIGKTDFFLLFVALALFGIFLILHTLNEEFTAEITKNQMAAFPIEAQINPYPFVQETPLLPLSAKSAIITDSDSQVVLFSKNPQLRFSMASTAKIMTALTALEYYHLNSILTVKTARTEGTILELQVGDQFYFADLLYAMLLPSANDAAVAIADNYPGGKEAFVLRMNEKAKALHLTSTHFSDPTGLDDNGDYTTVTDMARLASFAIKNKTFVSVTSTKQKIITNLGQSKQFALTNLNKLLGTHGVTGIKTGTTEGAKEVLVTSTVANGHTFIIVVMNSEDRFGDTGMLLNLIAQKVQFVNPALPQ